MLTTEENERLTRIGPGTPAGELLRRYWQPAALSEEVLRGGAPPPLLPDYEFLTVADENRFVSKLFSECNYLQGNEGNQDPVHLSFLHTINTEEARTSNLLQGRGQAPRIEAETTEWGVRIYAIRR